MKIDFQSFFKFHFKNSFDPNLLITINCNNPICSRAKEAYSIWGNDFLKHYKNVEIKFVTTLKNVTEPEKTLLCRPRPVNLSYRQMFYNNYRAYSYFYTKTKKDWIFRTTEDVFVHKDNFMRLLENIEKTRANQINNKPIFIAEVVYPSKWVHGGPGWIMNRIAAKIWLDNIKRINHYWELHKYVGDDVIIDEFLRLSNISWDDVHTPLFYGFPITNLTEKILMKKDWNSFEKCPPINTSYPPIRAKVNDVAVWHSGTKSNFAVYHGREIIKTAPNNLYMYYLNSKDGEYTSFCKE